MRHYFVVDNTLVYVNHGNFLKTESKKTFEHLLVNASKSDMDLKKVVSRSKMSRKIERNSFSKFCLDVTQI